jgi:hypothetical protein
MAVKYIYVDQKMYQHLPSQDPPIFTQNWDFWFENIPTLWQPCMQYIKNKIPQTFSKLLDIFSKIIMTKDSTISPYTYLHT